jgi:hypothetical protein
MSLSNIFLTTRKSWELILQFASWVLALAGTFIITPPLMSYTEPSQVESITRFVIAAITALTFIPIKRKTGKMYYHFWQRLAILFFLLAMSSTITYTIAIDQLSEPFYNNTRLVKGNNMLLSEKQLQDSLGMVRRIPVSDEEYIKQRAGMVSTIWPEAEVKNNFYLLASLYTLTIIFLCLFLVIMIQAIQCHNNEPLIPEQ